MRREKRGVNTGFLETPESFPPSFHVPFFKRKKKAGKKDGFRVMDFEYAPAIAL